MDAWPGLDPGRVKPDGPERTNMRIAVVGGRLQGTEAVYLAKKAGWRTLLLDKGRKPPGLGHVRRIHPP